MWGIPAQGETWGSPFKGHEMDVLTQQQEQQRLLLERFQQEVRETFKLSIWEGSRRHNILHFVHLQHPGFDFSGAEVKGTVPNARTFMRE
jgi:hypothetical protein